MPNFRQLVSAALKHVDNYDVLRLHYHSDKAYVDPDGFRPPEALTEKRVLGVNSNCKGSFGTELYIMSK